MLSLWTPASRGRAIALRLHRPPTSASSEHRLAAAGAPAQDSTPPSPPRQILSFSTAKKKRQKETDRLEELRDLRRRLVRLIVSYETERKNAAR